MKATNAEYSDMAETPKTNVTLADDADGKFIVQYYAKRLKRPSDGATIYEWHGNCYAERIDTAAWTPANDMVQCIMVWYSATASNDPTNIGSNQDVFAVKMNFAGKTSADTNAWRCEDGYKSESDPVSTTVTTDSVSNCMANTDKSLSAFTDGTDPDSTGDVGAFRGHWMRRM